MTFKRLSFILLFSSIPLFSYALLATAEIYPSSINWYSGGETKLKLNPIPAKTTSILIFSGTTTQKSLLVTIAKTGGSSRKSLIPVSDDGSFNVRYLIKDGIGNYNITFAGSEKKSGLQFKGLATHTLSVNENLPEELQHIELNNNIITFIDSALGTQVGRGECWDLIQEALDSNLADWTRPTSFGLPINPKSTEVKAGDIIQFKSLKTIESLPSNGTLVEILGNPDHTAVIYKVLGENHFTLAHQNVKGKRIVIKSDINLGNTVSGQYWIYRPVALMLKNG